MQHTVTDRNEVTQKIREVLSEQALFVTLVDLIQLCILIFCGRATEQRWNYLERRLETVTKFVEGKSKLKKMVVDLLSNNRLIDLSSENVYRHLNQAFENALRKMTDMELVLEQEENLVFRKNSYKLKKYKITQKGLELLKDDSLLTAYLKTIIAYGENLT